MYTPKFELDGFSTLPTQRKQIVLRAFLEALVVADWNYLLENPGTGSIYDVGPQYVLKVRPMGLDSWQDIPRTIELGSGDCVAAGELVRTERGEVPIENVLIGDRVATRSGWNRVTNQGCLKLNAPVRKLLTSSGHEVRATAEHKFWTTNRDWTPLGELRPGDELTELHDGERLKSSRVVSVSDAGYANVYDLSVEGKHEFFCNSVHLSNCKDFACVKSSTIINTYRGRIPVRDVVVGDLVSTRSGFKRVAGQMLTRRDAETCLLSTVSGKQLCATPDHRIWTREREWVECADLKETDEVLETNTSGTERMHVKVKSVKTAGREDVYDLAVEEAHEFFADGVLVHNCWRIAELRNAGYDDVYPHIKVSYHHDPRGVEPPMTVYHIQVRIHETIEDPSAILGMPTNVTYDQLRA